MRVCETTRLFSLSGREHLANLRITCAKTTMSAHGGSTEEASGITSNYFKSYSTATDFGKVASSLSLENGTQDKNISTFFGIFFGRRRVFLCILANGPPLTGQSKESFVITSLNKITVGTVPGPFSCHTR